MSNNQRHPADLKFRETREWRGRLQPQQLRREPLCRFCLALGHVEVAVHVDHIKPPLGDSHLQRNPENYQSLCASCHSIKTAWERGGRQRDLVIGRDRDGWPVVAEGGTVPRCKSI